MFSDNRVCRFQVPSQFKERNMLHWPFNFFVFFDHYYFCHFILSLTLGWLSLFYHLEWSPCLRMNSLPVAMCPSLLKSHCPRPTTVLNFTRHQALSTFLTVIVQYLCQLLIFCTITTQFIMIRTFSNNGKISWFSLVSFLQVSEFLKLRFFPENWFLEIIMPEKKLFQMLTV